MRSLIYLTIFLSACIEEVPLKLTELVIDQSTLALDLSQKDQKIEGLDQYIKPDFLLLDMRSIAENDQNIDQNIIDQKIPLDINLAHETCNQKDDDLDGKIDESQACSDLLVNHCEVFLGIADRNQITQPVLSWQANTPQMMSNICNNLSADPSYNCTSTKKDQKFHPIVIYGTLDDQDWLGLGFKCDTQENDSKEQKDVLNWVNQNCHVSLGYQNSTTDQVGIWNISTDACVTRSPNQNEIEPRCVKSSLNPNGDLLFSVLQLGSEKKPTVGSPVVASDFIGVNENDSFGIAFKCLSRDDAYNQTIQSSIELFFGMNFPRYIEMDDFGIERDKCDQAQMLTGHNPSFEFYGCPDQLIDQSDNPDEFNQNHFCLGSKPDGTWQFSNLKNHQNQNGNACDEFVIALLKARIR